MPRQGRHPGDRQYDLRYSYNLDCTNNSPPTNSILSQSFWLSSIGTHSSTPQVPRQWQTQTQVPGPRQTQSPVFPLLQPTSYVSQLQPSQPLLASRQPVLTVEVSSALPHLVVDGLATPAFSSFQSNLAHRVRKRIPLSILWSVLVYRLTDPTHCILAAVTQIIVIIARQNFRST